VEDKGSKDLVFTNKERVQIGTGRACRLGKPAGVYVVRAFLEGCGLQALIFERGYQPNRKGSLAGTPLEPGYDYPWNIVSRLSGSY
jgi:hypothetical protein